MAKNITKSVSRRAFLRTATASGATVAGAAISGAALAQPFTINQKILKPIDIDVFRPVQICRVRKNINSLTATELDALKAGVAAMQARPASDPTSWAYQAAIHGSTVTPALALWNTCKHSSLHFFSWHRLYLYYFERILRAASGSSSLTLPYWNWTTSRALPAAYRDSTPGNPLFTTNRGAGINGGALLPTTSVSYATAFADVAFDDFSGDIEGTPHGAVHVSVGGWMGSVPTAGKDPIFYLHHCNIDRLWEKWLAQGGGRANPTNAAWLNQSFSFFDETGTQRSRKASDGLSICPGLRYTYAKDRILVLNPAILALLLSHAQVAKLQPRLTISAETRAVLGARATQLKLPLARVGPAVANGGRVLLSFDDIRVDEGQGYYEIYLNAPGGKANPEDASYLGNLVTFGLSAAERRVAHDMDDMDHGPPRRVYDISRKLAQLGAAKRLGDTLEVMLVLRLPEGVRAESKPRGEIAKVSLLVE